MSLNLKVLFFIDALILVNSDNSIHFIMYKLLSHNTCAAKWCLN